MTTRHYLLLCLLALASAASCTKDVLEGETSSPDEESEELSSIPGIQESSPVMRKKIADFNDPGFGQQWGLYQFSGIDINVSRVWEEFGTGSSDVIVSVIDTGVDLEHEDLAANAIPAGSRVESASGAMFSLPASLTFGLGYSF